MSFPDRQPRPLRLLPGTPPVGEHRADALFLPGGDPLEWLEEICAWNLGEAQAVVRLYVLGRSPEDRAATGVLAVLPGGCPVPGETRGQPYRVLGGRLYLPLAARLEPPVSDEELAHLCREADAMVFHPGAGLCTFRASEALSMASLLFPPARTAEHWTAASPGLTPDERLRSVRLEAPADLDALFGDAVREIGADRDDAAGLPPAPGEPGSGLSERASRGLRELLGRLALGITGALPRNACAPTWVNRLENWAGKHLERLTREMSQRRHQELHRLLHELDENPETGLRHAIPLSDLPRNRGEARPGSRLGERDPNFRLGDLAGGKAGDSWQVPPDLHGRLRERYRELANEEIRLGRHRRAAYIHAELLGDLSSAAACLKQGRHFHEAAVLYRDHLRRPLEAADCLALGGELAAAIPIYEEQKRFLRVAELCCALGDEPRAVAAYRQETDRLIADDDLLAAAGLLAGRLGEPDEAVNLLRGGWPASRQAGRCLESAFALLGAGGQHPQAAVWLAELAAEPPPGAQTATLARQLATVQATYPDETVRHAARDLALVMVAARLPEAASPEIRSLLDVLQRGCPGDRLLRRDGDRYLAERLAQEKRRAGAAPARTGGKSLTLPPRQARRIGGFRLPEGVRWRQARSVGSHFHAAGYTSRGDLVLVRAGWDGFQQTLRWGPFDEEGKPAVYRPLLLEAPRESAGFVVCAFHGAADYSPALAQYRRFPAADSAWAQAADGGEPPWWPRPVFAATYAADGTLWLLHAVGDGGGTNRPELVLSCRGSGGDLYSQMLMLVPDADLGRLLSGEAPVQLTTVGAHFLAAGLNRLLIHAGAAGWRELEFESNILGLVPTPPLARAGCAALREDGVSLVWLDNLASVQSVAENLSRPVAAFTRAGTLAVLAADAGQGHVYDLARRGAGPALDFDWRGRAVAVLTTDERTGFAVVGENGAVEIYVG